MVNIPFNVVVVGGGGNGGDVVIVGYNHMCVLHVTLKAINYD
mgnify:CR=1 FL=1